MENKVCVIVAWGIDYDGDYNEGIEAIYQTEELAKEHLAYARKFYENEKDEKVISARVDRIDFDDEEHGCQHGLYYNNVTVFNELCAADIYDQFRNES